MEMMKGGDGGGVPTGERRRSADGEEDANNNLEDARIAGSSDEDGVGDDEILVTPAHLLVEKTPEGFRRIRGAGGPTAREAPQGAAAAAPVPPPGGP